MVLYRGHIYIEIHVYPIGVPGASDEPFCVLTYNNVNITGIGADDSSGLPGYTDESLTCQFDFDC